MKTRLLIIIAAVSGFGLLAITSSSFYGMANFLGVGLPYTEYGQIDYEKIGYDASMVDFKTKLDEKDTLYNPDNFVLIQGMSLESYPPITDYCGYVIADGGSDYWYQSVFKNNKLSRNQITEENPMPCRPNMGSCMCSLEQEITARFGPELSYFNEKEEQKVAEIVRHEFETSVANIPSEFELVVGKYNFDYGDKYTEFCGKTSFGREFSGVLFDDENLVDFSISIDNPKLCAYSENQNHGEIRFGWEVGDKVFVSKPKFLVPTSQDEDIAATGNTVYVAMTTPHHLGVMVMPSYDGGFSFENPEGVNKDLRGIAQNPAISVLDNNIYVVWEETVNVDGKEPKKIVKAAKSTDNARSFSEPVVLEMFSESSVISDFELLSYDNAIYVAWTSSTHDSSKLYLAVSNDNGKTFMSETVHDSENALQKVKLGECVHGACIEWTESEIRYGKTIDQDNPFDNVTPIPFSQTTKSDVIAYDGNFYTAWASDSGMSLSILFARASDTDHLSENAIKISDMQLATDTGTNMPMPTEAELPVPAVAVGNNVVYVTWKYPHNGIVSAWLAVSADDGSTFSEPIILNENLNHIVTSHPILIVTENKMYLSYTGYYEDEDISRVNVVEATH